MIKVRVLDIQPHPDQATNNPGTWAVQFSVSYDGQKRSFWRWHDVRDTDDIGRYVRSTRKPAVDEILKSFWDDTFASLHGFTFDKDEP